MNSTAETLFFRELDHCVDLVRGYLNSPQHIRRFRHNDLLEAVTLYTNSGGKRLRPAILLWSCGAVGADPEIALPAAAAVELFHTWSLVHDDIIDRDDLRRGNDTVHARFRRIAKERFPGITDLDAQHFGVSVAVLTGDVQHGWAISMLSEMSRLGGVDPALTLYLIDEIDTEVLNLLVEGEILDLQFSHIPLSELTLERIEDMVWKKTGVLYQFCARAGGMIGLGRVETDHPEIKALGSFSRKCGIAFQLQDDILGVVGDRKILGKPVGSDIREGKRTAVLHHAYTEATPSERLIIDEALGRTGTRASEIEKVVEILVRRGGVEKTREQAQELVESAYAELDILPPSRYRDLLLSWADFMISREW